MKISVAMATYNGEKYLQEQLNSLLSQNYEPCEMVICDDGSTDQTLCIAKKFAASAPFPVTICRNEKNLGYSDNFLKAAKICRGDWVAFCDQDDVWLPNKLQDVADAVRGRSDITMILQNADLCDERLKPCGRIFPDRIRPGIYGANCQFGFWVWPGFLKTVRSDWVAVIDSVNRPPDYFDGERLQSHDKWTCMIANALGGICVLGGPAARYRRHEAALTGGYTGKALSERVSEARAVDGKHYRFFEEVARSSSSYLYRIANEPANERWRSAFVSSAYMLDRLANIQSERAALYETERPVARAKYFLRIWLNGGYAGPAFTAMGLRSALKDAARTCAGSRLVSIVTR